MEINNSFDRGQTVTLKPLKHGALDIRKKILPLSAKLIMSVIDIDMHLTEFELTDLIFVPLFAPLSTINRKLIYYPPGWVERGEIGDFSYA